MHKQICDANTLIREVSKGFRPKYLFFWGHRPRKDGQIGKECLSHWWRASFEIAGTTYPTVEHYMMSEKARLFCDDSACRQILLAPSPETAKRLGRGIRGFDEETWCKRRFSIAVSGNEAKFRQNEGLRSFLSSTKERILVEASPVDKVWGIGLAADDPRATNPRKWIGLNLLGFALMEVRSRLRE